MKAVPASFTVNASRLPKFGAFEWNYSILEKIHYNSKLFKYILFVVRFIYYGLAVSG